jgi:hypothetical protein
MTAPAPCRWCGATDTEHLCLFCGVCSAFTRHEQDRRRRWRCVPCEERARLLGARYGGKGRAGFVVKRLDLGIWGPPERPATPRLEDIYN